MNEKPSTLFKLLGTMVGVLLWSICAYHFRGKGVGYVFLALAIVCVIVAIRESYELGWSKRG